MKFLKFRNPVLIRKTNNKMKKIHLFPIFLIIACLCATNGQAQEAEKPEVKSTWRHYTHAQKKQYPKEPYLQAVPVTRFSPPYSEIKLLDGDDREQTFLITDKTTFHNENNPKQKQIAISKESIKEDSIVTIVYTVSNNKMVVLDITIPQKRDDGAKKKSDDNVKLKGVLEAYENGIAIIGGSKVKLMPKTTITCVSKPECECKCPGLKKEQKGKMAYILDSFLVSKAPFVNVKGDIHEDGILYAEEMEIKENLETNLDKRYFAKLQEVVNTKNIVLSPTNEYAKFAFKGNISVAETSYNLLEDSVVQKYINLIGRRVTPQWYSKIAKERNIVPSFYVLNNAVPDAFSYGDGKVFITTGLLKLTKNEHQLAFILAHEIAHITHKHSIDYFSQSIIIDRAFKVVDMGAKVFVLTQQIKQGKIGQPNPQSTTTPKDTLSPSGVDSLGQMPSVDSTSPPDPTQTGQMSQSSQIITSIIDVLYALKPLYFNSILPASKEMQADRVGLLYLKQAGYDIAEVPKLWDNIMLCNKEEKFFDNLLTATYKTVSSSPSVNNLVTKQEMSTPETIGFAKDLITNLFTQTPYLSIYKAKKRLKQTNILLESESHKYQPSTNLINIDDFNDLKRILEQ